MPSGCAHCSEPSACQQCARCKGVVYCNANCQQQHWPQVQRLTSAAHRCLALTAICGAHRAHMLLFIAVCGAHCAHAAAHCCLWRSLHTYAAAHRCLWCSLCTCCCSLLFVALTARICCCSLLFVALTHCPQIRRSLPTYDAHRQRGSTRNGARRRNSSDS